MDKILTKEEIAEQNITNFSRIFLSEKKQEIFDAMEQYAQQFERPDNDSGQGWSTEQLIEKVKQFYKEKELNPKSELSGEIVCSRLVLFTEWLNGSKEETWEDILNAQPK